jgi:toxin ParE1/3/4
MPAQKMTQAKADLIEIADYIAADNPEAAACFLDAAEATFAFIASLPSVGRTFSFQSPVAQGMRVWREEGFERYLIVYRVVESHIEIIRVLHMARDFPAIFGDCSESTGLPPEDV